MNGIEFFIIGMAAIVIILWSPAKNPKFFPALGRAKGGI
jgi:hypothetical protein